MGQTQKLNRVSYVDPKACTGCEACVVTAPKVFRMTADGLAEVYDAQGEKEDKIQEAMDGCPVACIHWKK